MTSASVERDNGFQVVHVDGHASDDDLAGLRRLLSTDRQLPTVLDLSDLVLAGDRVGAVVGHLVDACGPVCIIVRRATAGLILQRLGIARRCPIFHSVGDALQALRMAAEGYGPGWATCPEEFCGEPAVGPARARPVADGGGDHNGRPGNGSREPGRPVVTPATTG